MINTSTNGSHRVFSQNESPYKGLSAELQARILADRAQGYVNPYRAEDSNVLRRDMSHDHANLWRPAYVRDVEKILHLPYYNRYADKTQVFSFYHNDDLTRRGLHVQLVSRIARNIGALLGLNLDLIEAISLGHDIGHTPFGHAGERYLDELLMAEAGIHFKHNIQSARVLDVLFTRNVSLQTLDGIICHNGEFEQQEYCPTGVVDFAQFDAQITECYMDKQADKRLQPATLEACVMRISDIIAYLGKDRQDAVIAKIIPENYAFSSAYLGTHNAKIINNLIVDIVEHSYGKNAICMSKAAYDDLKAAKDENYHVIYQNEAVECKYREIIHPMFEELYYRLLHDVKSGDENSLIYKHHIEFINNGRSHYRGGDYRDENPNLIVADYIASMTDDYFLDLYRHLFPDSPRRIEYRSYFE